MLRILDVTGGQRSRLAVDMSGNLSPADPEQKPLSPCLHSDMVYVLHLDDQAWESMCLMSE